MQELNSASKDGMQQYDWIILSSTKSVSKFRVFTHFDPLNAMNSARSTRIQHSMTDHKNTRYRIHRHIAAHTSLSRYNIHSSRHQLIHVRPLLHALILLLEEHRKHLDGRIEVQHFRTPPAL